MYQQFRVGDALDCHVMLANAPHHPDPAWFSAVVHLQQRFNVPDFVVKGHVASISPVALRRQLHKYAANIVKPSVSSGLGHAAMHTPLPWAWAAATLSTAHEALGFECWLAWKCVGSLPNSTRQCAACDTGDPPTATHLMSKCLLASAVWHGHGRTDAVEQLFCDPQDPEIFRLQITVAAKLAQGCCRVVSQQNRQNTQR